MRAAAAALVALTFVMSAVSAAPAAGAAGERFRLKDPRIDEASGIAAGIRSDVVYVQNDSGDSARFFAVDPSSGATRAVFTVTGARNVDWEDIAVARDARGTPSVWVADIGDNDAKRHSVELYRVDEPDVPPGASAADFAIGPAEVWRLRYPDGPHDAETLIVDDDGRAFVVTKSVIGSSGVYEVPASPGASVQTMTRVGTVRFKPTSTPGPFGIVGHLTATGGAYGAGVVVIRTYTDAYVWAAPHGVVAALRTEPTRVALPRQDQGEGVCVSRGQLLVDSEGADSPVYAVAFRRPGASTSPSASPSTAPLPRTSQPALLQHSGRSTGTIVVLVLVTAGVAFFAVGFVAVGLIMWLRRRRRV